MMASIKRLWANKRFRFAFKAVITLGLITWLLQQVDLPHLVQQLQTVNPQWVLLSIGITLGRNFLAGWRLQMLLAGQGVRIHYWQAIKGYYYGFFFNFFLPTAMGGDVVRAYLLKQDKVPLEHRASSVVMERVLGFLALTLIPCAVLPFYPALFQTIPEVTGLVLLDLGILVMILFLLFGGVGAVLRKLGRESSKIMTAVNRYVTTFEGYAKHRRHLFGGLLLSFLYQLFGIVSVYCLSQAAGATLPFHYFLLLMPTVWLLSMIPISVNGIGVRESGFVALFGLVGLAEAPALVVSTFFLVLLVIQALLGGLWLLVSSEKITTFQQKSSDGDESLDRL